MCDINKKTKLTTKIIYKVVKKIDGNYVSCFSGYELELGPVKTEWEPCCKYRMLPLPKYHPGEGLYNANMIGKISGFASSCWAISLSEGLILSKAYVRAGVKHVVVKIKLGGEIWKGSSKKISNNVPDYALTYAGTEILTIKEI